MIRIDPRKLLWRTRGATWDFQFLLRPTVPADAVWTEVFAQIFPETSAPRSGVEYRRGYLRSAGQAGGPGLPFRAAAFMDPTRSDASGRAIQHFFVLVGVDEPALDKAQWALPVLDALTPAYQPAFELHRHDGESGDGFAQRLQALFLTRVPSELAVPLAEGTPPPRYMDLGDLKPAVRHEPRPPLTPPGEAPEDSPTRAGPAVGLGSIIHGGLRALGLALPSRHEQRITELVEEMAKREGPEAARQLLERLLERLALRR